MLKQGSVSAVNKVRLSPEAIADLDNLNDYISKKLKNPTAAANIIEKIVKTLRILEQHSQAGSSVEALTGYKTDLRYLVCGNYIALYRIEENFVSVARIINSRQDYMRIIFGNYEPDGE